jgi:carbamate kinase
MSETIVIAVGGNSLITDSEHISVEDQFHAAEKTARNIITLIEEGHNIVIVHGNGPQVGFILRRGELAAKELHTVPLDSCVADTQGALGYNIQMALDNELIKRGTARPTVTVVTQVEVSPQDPAFDNPTKPIGSFMDEETARTRERENGWIVKEDAGRGWRRVIPSPKPNSIIEIDVIKMLLDRGVVVVAAGGGGIPVKRHNNGTLEGVEAVIDKDHAASLLAHEVKADRFIISTAVEKVCLNFGTPEQKDLDELTVAEAREYIAAGHFAPGSMLPKIEAMVKFVEDTGRKGIITDPAHLADALKGTAGTHLCP